MSPKIKVAIGDLIFEGTPGELRSSIVAAEFPEIKGVSAILAGNEDGYIFATIVDEEVLPLALNELFDLLQQIEDGTVTVEELIKMNAGDEEPETV